MDIFFVINAKIIARYPLNQPVGHWPGISTWMRPDNRELVADKLPVSGN